MRTAFVEGLSELAAENPHILLVTGDLGFGVLADFRERFPDQFLNVGVAEQNLASVAAGLALSGHIVFTYSIGNFPTLRCLEQIRNDICYHRANVNVVSVGGGLAYGSLGMSHHATEDMAILRVLPEMMVVAPGDPVETRKLLPQIVAHDGPAYLRLGRAGESHIVSSEATVKLGKPTTVRSGSDLLLLTTGGMLPVAVGVADQLDREGVSVHVASVHTLSPLDESVIRSMLEAFPTVITCEEHSIHGGLGGCIAEVIAESGLNPTFRRLGLRGRFAEGVGSPEYLRAHNDIGHEALLDLARSLHAQATAFEVKAMRS